MGRDEEIAHLLSLLTRPGPAPAAVLLHGAPGVGKSRLAAAVTAAYRGATGAATATVVPPTATGDPGSAAVEAALALAAVRGEQGPAPLLTVDGADAVDQRNLLAAAGSAGVVVLATARADRPAAGLVSVPVRGLRLPRDCSTADPEGFAAVPSVQLYLARLRTLNPEAAVHGGNQQAIARTCAQLRGVPGALGLAARMAALEGPETVWNALSAPYGGRLTDLLRMYGVPSAGTDAETDGGRAGGGDDGGDSGDGGSAQRLLARCAVFADGFGTEALREISGVRTAGFATALHTLLAQGLLTLSAQPSGQLDGPVRTRLQVPLTALPLPPDPGAETARLAHARYYARVARTAARQIAEGDQRAGITVFRAEEANLRAALETLFTHGDGDPDEALDLAEDLLVHWYATGPTAIRAGVLDPLARRAATHRPCRRAQSLLTEATVLAGHPEAARPLLDGAAGADTSGPDGGRLLRLRGLAAVHSDPADGTASLRRAAERRAADGDRHGAARVALEAALADLLYGEVRRGEDTALETLCGALRRGDVFAAGSALLHLALFAAAAGRTRQAADRHARALASLRSLGAPAVLGAHLTLLAGPLLPGPTGRARATARVLGCFYASRAAFLDDPDESPFTTARCEEPVRRLLGEEAFRAALAEGAGLSLLDLVTAFAARRRDGGAPAAPEAPRAGYGGPPAPAVLERRAPATAAATEELTPRQTEVSQLVALGLSNKQIARQLEISEWTVVNHIREVMRRLGCASRVGIARWAHEAEHRRAATAGMSLSPGAGVRRDAV
ncbi:LuxR C-terminal-related transcriptional regulator (plasmid) [Streptomyces clavuligerus]|nr:LuxR C-terminal-related transcriptional regulator [Streptomyces clavuligerus]